MRSLQGWMLAHVSLISWREQKVNPKRKATDWLLGKRPGGWPQIHRFGRSLGFSTIDSSLSAGKKTWCHGVFGWILRCWREWQADSNNMCLCQNVGDSLIKADGHPPIVRAHNISIESGIPFMMVGWPGAPFTLMLLNHGTYANLWGQRVIAIRHKFAKHNSVGKPSLNHLQPWVVPCWRFYPQVWLKIQFYCSSPRRLTANGGSKHVPDL